MVAMMNIEDDISIGLNKNGNQQFLPKSLQAKINKEPTIPNSATYKIGAKHLLSHANMDTSTITEFKQKGLDHAIKEPLSALPKKSGGGIPDMIKNAIAETIKATESPVPKHMLEDCDSKTEDGESSYYDKSSDISDLEILKNSEALLSKYGALYQE